ncbi:MAG: AsmA-like C-terminal region-containing protein [Bacteroidota bacterium]
MSDSLTKEGIPSGRKKKYIILSVLAVMLIALTGWVLSFFYGDSLRQMMVTALNQRLTAKVEVREIDFTVFSSFPYAAVRFSDVEIKNPQGFSSREPLMVAKEIGFRFRIWDLLTGGVKLSGVKMSGAELNLMVNKKGLRNFDIFKEEVDTTSQGLEVDLNTVSISDSKIKYADLGSKQLFAFVIDQGEVGGDFSDERYAAELNATMKSATIEINQVKYIDQKPIEIEASIQVNQQTESYVLDKCDLLLAGMSFQLNGTAKALSPEQMQMDLAFSSKDADIASLISLLPNHVSGRFADFNCSGTVAFKGSFKGAVGGGEAPVFNVSFEASNASANPQGTPYKITELNGKGSFTSRKSNAAPYESLSLNSINAKLEGSPFSLDLNIEDFANPKLDLTLKADANLNVLSSFYKPDTIESVSGMFSADLVFNGIAKQKSTYKSSGSIRFNDAVFSLKGRPDFLSGMNGILHLRGNDMVLEGLSGKIGNTDFSVTGSFNNLMAYFLLDDQQVDVEATLKSNAIDLNELLVGENDSDTSGIDITDRHRISLDLEVASLKFRKFHASSIKGAVLIAGAKVSSDALDFSTCGGAIQLSGVMDESDADSIRVNCVAQIRNVEISQLFQQMGNFGQTTLTDKNLKGRLSANVEFKSRWDKQLNFDERSVYAKSDISIENGELIQFKPMLALAKYLKGSDLENIRFSNLTNTIEIKDRKIYVPVMDIRSSAMDLTASGVHTFDNMVDYQLGLYLSQLVGRKVKQMNTEFGTIEDDGLGRPRIYLSMKGPAYDPKFTWDRKGTEQKITDEIRKERETIRDLLKKEFGGKSNDGTESIPTQSKDKSRNNELELETED